ncbi:MAG: hypothetical protein ACI4E1_14765 [Lachnospira sp.]
MLCSSLEPTNTTEKVTIEKTYQGGINAVNGIKSIFMVTQIQIVPNAPRAKREREREEERRIAEKKEKSFDDFFDEAVDVQINADQNLDTRNVTYGPDSRLNTFFYQQKSLSL